MFLSIFVLFCFWDEGFAVRSRQSLNLGPSRNHSQCWYSTHVLLTALALNLVFVLRVEEECF